LACCPALFRNHEETLTSAASVDEGESWSEIVSYLPGITSVEVAVAVVE
jgi:hypothetical protein